MALTLTNALRGRFKLGMTTYVYLNTYDRWIDSPYSLPLNSLLCDPEASFQSKLCPKLLEKLKEKII